jgi:site-specific DNA-methyltransferase (adenine-specific)
MDIRRGDGIAGLAQLTDVDLICSDLPSGKTDAKTDLLPDLSAFWAAAKSALTTTGRVVLMASHLTFATQLIQTAPRNWYRCDYVWSKNQPSGFLNARFYPLKNHEHILVFGPSSKTATYHPQMSEGHKPITCGRVSTKTSNYGLPKHSGWRRMGRTDRYPTTVIDDIKCIPNGSESRIHHQQKPTELLSYLIRTWSKPGDLVVDPFAGSGSTGAAALQEERRFIGFEISDCQHLEVG